MIKDESIGPAAPTKPIPHDVEPERTNLKPFLALAIVCGVLLLLGDTIVAHTAPLENLLLSTEWSAVGAIHGVLGSTLFISGSISVYLSYRLLMGRTESTGDLKIASLVTTIAAFVTVVVGNWIYIGYRQPGMVQDYFLQNTPELHLIFFEFKENIALFTVPLATAATFILFRYGDELSERPWIRTVVFLLLALVFMFFLVAFGLGAAITKVRPV